MTLKKSNFTTWALSTL